MLYFTTAIKHSRVNVVYSNIYSIAKDSVCTGMLISPLPDQEGNKVMFLSECREYPSAPCLAGGKKLDSSRLDVVEIARDHDMLPSLFPS